MKCLLCPVTMDEAQKFPPIEGPGGMLVEDVGGRLRLARSLESWTHVYLTAQTKGGAQTVFAGHLCPGHDLAALGLTETKPTKGLRPEGTRPEGPRPEGPRPEGLRPEGDKK